ncbi:MAG: hypothetical protein ACXVAY_21930 [Mucilaginibacter sp.]
MIKLYILYCVLGSYLLIESITVRLFGEDSIITYLALISAGILYLVATGLSLYSVKIASIVELIALIGVFPFGIHWLLYRITMEGPITKGAFNHIVLLICILYFAGVFYSVKYSIRKDSSVNSIKVSPRVKLLIALLLPILLSPLALGLLMLIT